MKKGNMIGVADSLSPTLANRPTIPCARTISLT
jgi:hypothetical protein